MKYTYILIRQEKEPNLFGVQETEIYGDSFSNIKAIYDFASAKYHLTNSEGFPPYKRVLDTLKHAQKDSFEIDSEIYRYVIRRVTIHSSFFVHAREEEKETIEERFL